MGSFDPGGVFSNLFGYQVDIGHRSRLVVNAR